MPGGGNTYCHAEVSGNERAVKGRVALGHTFSGKRLSVACCEDECCLQGAQAVQLGLQGSQAPCTMRRLWHGGDSDQHIAQEGEGGAPEPGRRPLCGLQG